MIAGLGDSTNVTLGHANTIHPSKDFVLYADTTMARGVLAIPSATVGAFNSQTVRLRTPVFDATGTFTFTVSSGTISGATTFKTLTVTVTAANSIPVAANTSSTLSLYANLGSAGDVTTSGWKDNVADSAPVVTAGATVGAYTAVAYIFIKQRNLDSETTYGAAATSIYETVTATLTGVGAVAGAMNNALLRTQVASVANGESIVVYSDGRAGTASVALSSASMGTFATKVVTLFSSTAASYELNMPAGGGVVDSLAALSGALRVVPKDSGGNFISSNARIYIYSSDTSILNMNGTACTDGSASTQGYYACSLSGWMKPGTVTLTVRDSSTVALSTAAVKAETSIVTVNRPETVTVSFDKRSYTPGEKATITITVTDGAGRPIANSTLSSLFESGGIVASRTLDSAGLGTLSAASYTFDNASNIAYGRGKAQVTVYMPTNFTGEISLYANRGDSLVTTTGVIGDTVTVTNPTTDAANAALDAAQEATDAAIAATDAAVLAQESADAAAVAAEAAAETAAEAADAAKAAVDAVTALSAEVTKLLTQFATLQKLMTRIAKKVGVKV